MKTLKFQQDLMKAAEKRDNQGTGIFNYPWFETENEICVAPYGYYLLKIPKCIFYLNKEMIFNTTPISGERLLNQDDLKAAKDTHTTLNTTMCGKKVKLHKFLVGQELVFANEDNLKYFELENSTFKGSNRKSPIFIYEEMTSGEEKMMGFVMPVNYKEGNE